MPGKIYHEIKYNFYAGVWNQDSYSLTIKNLDMQTMNLVRLNVFQQSVILVR